MTLENAIKFAIIHPTREAHNWWHHGIITLGHKSITTYGEFTQKLISRFNQKEPKWYFQDLIHLKQIGTIEEFTNKFQSLSVMVPDIFQKRTVYMFIEGLKEHIKIG